MSSTSQAEDPFVIHKFSNQNVRLLSNDPTSGNKVNRQNVIADSILTKEILNGIDYCLNPA